MSNYEKPIERDVDLMGNRRHPFTLHYRYDARSEQHLLSMTLLNGTLSVEVDLGEDLARKVRFFRDMILTQILRIKRDERNKDP